MYQGVFSNLLWLLFAKKNDFVMNKESAVSDRASDRSLLHYKQ
jgi:hypothetical protein